MVRGVIGILAAWLCLGLSTTSWAQSDEVLVVWSGGQPKKADVARIQRQLDAEGMRVFSVQTPAQLASELQLLPIRTGRIAKACLERIDYDLWRSDLDRAEVAVQVFQSEKALNILKDLEDQLPCLETVVAPMELRRWSLTRVLALSLSGAPDSELQAAIQNMQAMVSDFLEPVGLSQELRKSFEASSRTENIRIFGGGREGEVFVDGETLSSGSVLRGSGTHLVQLRDPRTQRVSSGQFVFLDRKKIVIWAGDLERNPVSGAVDEVVHRRQRSALLRTVSVVQGRTILIATRGAGGVEMFHVDGRRWGGETTVKRPVEEPRPVQKESLETRPAWSAPEWSVGAGVQWSPTFMPGRTLRGAGVEVWGRWWADRDWSVALETGVVVRPVLLDPAAEDFYRFDRSLPLRLGGAWRSEGVSTHVEAGMYAVSMVGLNHREAVFGGGLSGAIYAPVWSNAALRLQMRAETGRGWWSVNGFVGVEWSL